MWILDQVILRFCCRNETPSSDIVANFVADTDANIRTDINTNFTADVNANVCVDTNADFRADADSDRCARAWLSPLEVHYVIWATCIVLQDFLSVSKSDLTKNISNHSITRALCSFICTQRLPLTSMVTHSNTAADHSIKALFCDRYLLVDRFIY